MSTHDRHRVPASHATPPHHERSTRAGGGATTRDLAARPSHDLPQEAPREMQDALAVQLKASAATNYAFERDPFGVGPVQRATGSPPSSVDTLAIAADGVRGSSTSLPHAEAIQQSFGHHDVSGIEAHVGGPAANAADATGAMAYATGNHVAFKQAPDVHTAAHEAAHVVQQRGAVQLKSGVGEAGDEYERNADAVADRVVQGVSAEDLLGATREQAGPTVLQRKAVGGGQGGAVGGETKHVGATSSVGGDTKPETGLPMVDGGFPCERGDGGECIFTPAQRLQVQLELHRRLGMDHANFQVAASEARLEVLLEKDSGWGFVAELLFNIASFTVIGGLVKGLSTLRKVGTVRDALVLMGGTASEGAMTQSLRESAASINVGVIETILVQVSKGARAQAKHAASSVPPDRAQRLEFIDRVREAHEQYIGALGMQAPASLDDAQLLALVLSLDHSVREYRDQLNDLIKRYKAHGIDELGENRLGRRQLARFRAYGRERLALVQLNDNREIFKYRGESYHSDDRRVFLQWVDADLQEAAEEMNELRNGTPPIIEAGHRLNVFGNQYTHGFFDIHGDEPRELNAWIDAAGGVDD